MRSSGLRQRIPTTSPVLNHRTPMADSDQTLKLLVQFGVVNAADVKAAQDLVTETAKAAGKAGEAHGEMGKGIKAAGEAAEESGISHRELRHTLLEIGNVAAPGAGRALSELAMGPIGAVLALVGAFEMLKRNLEEADKEADKLAEALEQPMDGGVASLETAWDNAAKRMGDYFAAMADAGRDKDPEATKLKQIKEITDAETASAKTIIQALAEVEEARLKNNGGSPEAIAALKLRTEEQLKALDQQRDHKNGVGLLQQEQTDDLAKTQGLYANTKKTSDLLKNAEWQHDHDEKLLAGAREVVSGKGELGEALKKKQEEAQKKLEAAQALPNTRQEIVGGALFAIEVDNRGNKEKAITAAEEESNRVQLERARFQKVVKQLGPEGNETARQAKLKEAQDAAKNASELDQKNKARIVQLQAEIDQAQKVEGIKNEGDATGQLLKRGAGAISGDGAAMHQTIQAAMAELKANQKITNDLAAAAHAATLGHKEVATALTQVLNELRQAQATLARQISGGRMNFGG